MGTRNAIAIDLSRRRLRAVQALVTRRGLQIRGMVVEDVPTDVDFQDAAAVGRWLAERLRAARIGHGPATLSVGREHVGLKRITLPTSDASELPEMTRLAMQRELPFDADSAIIDFVPLERTETSTTVLAVAVPRQQIDFLRDAAAAAGLRVRRIALRTMGAAALLGSLINDESGVRIEDVDRVTDDTSGIAANRHGGRQPTATLIVDVVGEGVEFCVVSTGMNGQGNAIRFSRAAEVPAPQDELAMAEAVVTEARRTWMSYRVGEESSGITAAVIMGDRRVAEYAAGPVGEMLRITPPPASQGTSPSLPVRVLREHPRIEAGEFDISRVWPLAGLLLEGEIAAERIDFLHPRKAPDVAARTRLRWLLAAASIIVVGGTAFTFMRMHLNELRYQADQLTTRRDEGAVAYARYDRDRYKAAHLQQWTGVHVDWLNHAAFLATVAPPPDQIVLDSWSGSLDVGQSGGVTFSKDIWAANHQATIVIEGEARDRSTADAFREALMQLTVYVANTTGADARGGKRMPFGFTYRLRTRADAPAQQDIKAEDVKTKDGSAATAAPAQEGATRSNSATPIARDAGDGADTGGQPAQ